MPSNRFAARLSYLSATSATPRRNLRVGAALKGATTPRLLPRDPARFLSARRQGLSVAGLTRRPLRCRREAVRPTTSPPPRARGRLHSTSTSRSLYRIDPFLGKWAPRLSSTCAFANAGWSRRGAATPRLAADHYGRESFRGRDEGHFYDPVGALRRRRRHPPEQVVRPRPHGIPSHPRLGRAKDSRHRCSPRCRADPSGLRARSVRVLPRHRMRGGRLDDGRPLRRASPDIDNWALVRRADLHPHRKPCEITQTELSSSSSARLAGVSMPSGRTRPSRWQLVVKADPATGVACSSGQRSHSVEKKKAPRADHHGDGVRRRGVGG